MKYVLDTNALSHAMAGEPSVCGQLLSRSRTDVLLPQPVVAEIAYGLSRLPRSKRRERLLNRFRLFLDQLPRVPWTDEVSRKFGEVKADLERRGIRIEDFDVAVAAHALTMGATLVSSDLRHMTRIAGLLVEDWHSRPAHESQAES
ncbi:MAG: type II toxin-antitoxin system VapC family toxin [Bryobacterales bacterium]|nr:type II toxin-antitoxin system VapC family toxin [Bryobacterales bacterium]MDE0621282.1 type II toxin-antitoxin system VapC family toxin [Bryobacterales bacterium]